MITASIIGGSGYAGGELLRILLSHPEVEVKQITSRKLVGLPVSSVHPNLRRGTNITFSNMEDLENCDVLFVALPNGKSMSLMKELSEKAERIIDLGADFRLRDAKTFEEWYGKTHEASGLLGEFVYGLAEVNRDKIRDAKYVACGGCEATAVILATYPLAQKELLTNDSPIADIKIGSSAAGSKAGKSSHHPERHGVLRSYKPTNHRHEAEIAQETNLNVEISATAVNIVRGILATIHFRLKEGVEEKDVWRAYREVYKDEPFIRIVKQKDGLYRYPEPKILWGSNFCDIGFEKSPASNRLVVISAIDNLVKGTAGQAAQAMNVMFDFDEELSLEFSGLHPV